MDQGLPGDVILYPASGASSLASRLVVAGEILAGMGRGLEQYSHAAVLSQFPGEQYEAYFPRTRRSRIDPRRPREIWRFGNPTDAERASILTWCMEHEGRWYNLIGVLTANRIRLPDTYYCSQFAGYAYRAAGISIGDDIFSPDSLPDTPGARKVWSYGAR